MFCHYQTFPSKTLWRLTTLKPTKCSVTEIHKATKKASVKAFYSA